MAVSRGDSDQRALSRNPAQQANRQIPRQVHRQAISHKSDYQLTLVGRQRRSRQTANEAMVHSFQPKPRPLWLSLLVRLQQSSSVITILLVIGTLAAYGWTVVIQERWGKQYDKLETLKKQERQLVSANEVLKNQMAEQAEKPTAGLLLPDPSNAIFLSPAPQRPEVKPKSTVPSVKPAQNRPLGY